MQLAAWLVHVAGDVGHAGLVAHEGCQVGLLAAVIPGEGFDLALATPAPLLWQEAQRPVPGVCRQQRLTVPEIALAADRYRSTGDIKLPVMLEEQKQQQLHNIRFMVAVPGCCTALCSTLKDVAAQIWNAARQRWGLNSQQQCKLTLKLAVAHPAFESPRLPECVTLVLCLLQRTMGPP